MITVFRMASGGHRIQGEHYHNEDIHLTVAYLRARKAQLSPQDAYYQRVQPERCQLKPQDDIMHGMPKYSKSFLYNNNYTHIRDSIQEEKAELKRRLQHVQRCEVDAEIQRQKRAEQWRQLVLKEEKEEHERKTKIESLQKLIKKEMQRKHRRCQTDVNSANSSTHIPNSYADLKDFSMTPCCSSASNTTGQPTVEADKTDNTEQTSTSSIPTYIDRVPHDDSATVDKVELASTVIERDADLHFRDQVITSASEEPSIKEQTDQSSVTTVAETDSPDGITVAETDSPDDITIAETDSPDDITVTETDSPDDITIAETDNHDDITTAESDSPGDITVAETDNHDDMTTSPQLKQTTIMTSLLLKQTTMMTSLQLKRTTMMTSLKIYHKEH